MTPAPCSCGGYADLRGGLVSMKHWVECRVCGASTRLCDGHYNALKEWREGLRLKPATHSRGCICPAGAETTCKGTLCPRKPIGRPQ